MLKNAILYKLAAPILATMAQLEEALQAAAFTPCGASQEKSVGWVPPRGDEHGALLESVASQWILKLMVESKAIPASVIKRKVQEQIDHIEETTGRKPGKKEKKELTEDARLTLLPMAFTKQSAVILWIDTAAGTLVVGTGSQSNADEAVTWLIKAVEGLALRMVSTQTSPAVAMAHWLATKEAPQHFSVDRECELKAADESKAVVKYGRHPLDTDEVAQHIAIGKMPTRLALTWTDRVSFVLTEGFQLKKINFLEAAMSGDKGMTQESDLFDADVVIMTGELSKLIPDLIDAMGGEMVEPEAPAAVEQPLTDAARALLIDGPDPLYDQAVAIVRKHDKASISLVQRHLTIGYNRAARLLEDMEKAGIVRSVGGVFTLVGAGVAA